MKFVVVWWMIVVVSVVMFILDVFELLCDSLSLASSKRVAAAFAAVFVVFCLVIVWNIFMRGVYVGFWIECMIIVLFKLFVWLKYVVMSWILVLFNCRWRFLIFVIILRVSLVMKCLVCVFLDMLEGNIYGMICVKWFEYVLCFVFDVLRNLCMILVWLLI